MFTFQKQGLVTLTKQERDFTYLREGDTYKYFLSDHDTYVHFTNTKTGGSTFEDVVMLNIFQKQGRLCFQAA
jgi:hypothetical protein